MPHNARWLVEKRVLYIKYTGVIEKEELGELNEELAIFLETGEEPIHILSDNMDMDKINADLKTFRQVFTAMRDKRWGWIMLVGADPITVFFGKLITHAFQLKIRMVKTIEDAKYALGVEDPQLADVLATDADTN